MQCTTRRQWYQNSQETKTFTSVIELSTSQTKHVSHNFPSFPSLLRFALVNQKLREIVPPSNNSTIIQNRDGYKITHEADNCEDSISQVQNLKVIHPPGFLILLILLRAARHLFIQILSNIHEWRDADFRHVKWMASLAWGLATGH